MSVNEKKTKPETDAEIGAENQSDESIPEFDENSPESSAASAGNGTDSLSDTSAELEALQKELLYQRAEFDNSKKRLIREQEQSIKFANEKLIREILTVVDHLERGVQHGKELGEKGQTTPKDFVTFVSGMEMTQRELAQLLSRFGVELIGSSGEAFDPAKHEAISQIDAPPEKQGTVLQVLQKGCLLNGRLLQPARVVVAK